MQAWIPSPWLWPLPQFTPFTSKAQVFFSAVCFEVRKTDWSGLGLGLRQTHGYSMGYGEEVAS